jgi:hypothetical protein
MTQHMTAPEKTRSLGETMNPRFSSLRVTLIPKPLPSDSLNVYLKGVGWTSKAPGW